MIIFDTGPSIMRLRCDQYSIDFWIKLKMAYFDQVDYMDIALVQNPIFTHNGQLLSFSILVEFPHKPDLILARVVRIGIVLYLIILLFLIV